MNRQQKRLLQLIVKNRALWPLIIVVVGVLYGYEVFVARPAASWMGLPQVQANGLENFTRIFRNEGYMVGYSEVRANPLWVVYRILPVPDENRASKRPSAFSSDWRSLRHITHDDYTGSGYDRGHMAPNYAIASRLGTNAQRETFLMTNITPQRSTLNQKLWQRLEEVAANDFSRQLGELWVVTGPIFGDKPKTLKSSGVQVPKAFYKIFVTAAPNPANSHVLAFIMPQNVKGNEALDRYVTTVDEIEKESGIDFFSELEDAIENRLEASANDPAWNLKAVANRPSRY